MLNISPKTSVCQFNRQVVYSFERWLICIFMHILDICIINQVKYLCSYFTDLACVRVGV